MAQRIAPEILDEKSGARNDTGENARMSAFLGGIAIADIVKTTLGPKGMDKILQPISAQGKLTFTNDGATILRSLPIDNPAAKIIIDTSKTQDEEVGDGTTSVAVLAGELLREAQKLVQQNIHPQTILRGWRKAVAVAREALLTSAQDHSSDEKAFREDLLNIAKTTLSSKILSVNKDHFANLCVDAVLRLRGSMDLAHIQLVKILGGQLVDSYLDEGFLLAKKIGVGQPKRIEGAVILVANTALDTDKIKIPGARVRAEGVAQVAEIEAAEQKKMRTKVEKIIEHKTADGTPINCFISRQLIYNFPEQMFTKAGIVSIEHADFEGVERLAAVLGAEITSTFDHPELTRLGRCDLIEEVVIGEDKLIRFSGVARGEACTIVVRGASQHILDEADRSLHDALCILTQTTANPKTVLGGGCSEMLMANAVDNLARSTAGKQSLAIEAFARALRQLPTTIADNGGYDSSELVSQLRAAHFNGQNTMGLDMSNGTIGDVSVLKITESYKSKSQVLISAHEAAEMILRVDDIISCAPRQREQGH